MANMPPWLAVRAVQFTSVICKGKGRARPGSDQPFRVDLRPPGGSVCIPPSGFIYAIKPGLAVLGYPAGYTRPLIKEINHWSPEYNDEK